MIKKFVLGALPALALLAATPAAFAQSSTMAMPMNNSTSAPATAAPMAAPTSEHAVAKTTAKLHKLPKSFTTEAAATASCKTDVVWVNTGSHAKIYHLSTSKYFGKTKHGVYACLRDAQMAGYHASKS
jgi:hypothetical protein